MNIWLISWLKESHVAQKKTNQTNRKPQRQHKEIVHLVAEKESEQETENCLKDTRGFKSKKKRKKERSTWFQSVRKEEVCLMGMIAVAQTKDEVGKFLGETWRCLLGEDHKKWKGQSDRDIEPWTCGEFVNSFALWSEEGKKGMESGRVFSGDCRCMWCKRTDRIPRRTESQCIWLLKGNCKRVSLLLQYMESENVGDVGQLLWGWV